MQIDALNDQFISVGQLAEMLPTKPSKATCWRWVTIGVRGVVLSSVMIGGRRMVSRQSIEDFVTSTTQSTLPKRKSKEERPASHGSK